MIKKNNCLVIRHGERPKAIGEGGSTPDDLLELTENGLRESQNLGNKLGKSIYGIHTSPVLRCRQTAENIAKGSGMNPSSIKTSSILAPEAISLDGFSESERQTIAHNLLLGKAESWLQSLADRAVVEMYDYFKNNTQNKIANAFISHDWVMSLFLASTTQCFELHSWDIWPKFTEYFEIDFEKMRITYRNESFVVITQKHA